jgi:hypothetical protein
LPPRTYSAVRTAIIGYGAVAFGYLQSSVAPAEAPRALGGFASSQGLLVAGLALQLLLMVARALVKRFATDNAALAQGMEMVGLAGDGVTVLLFALGTYGAIAPAGRDL